MGHRRPNANTLPRNTDTASTSPSGHADHEQATPSAPAPQAPSPVRPAPQTLATGLTGTNAEEEVHVPSEATIEDVRRWNREWYENISVRLWHPTPTRRLPVYDDSDLFVYYANANFNRIVRHRYEETAFPAPLNMSDSGAEATHWSMPSIARFDNRPVQPQDLSLDELPDYESWLQGFRAQSGPRASEERPSLSTSASRVPEGRSAAPRDLAMGFEAVTAPAENVGPDSSVVGGGSSDQPTNSEVAPKNTHSTPQKPKNEKSPPGKMTIPQAAMNASTLASSVLQGTINVPRVYEHVNYDEDPTIYDIGRHLQMLMEPLAPRVSPNAPNPQAAMNVVDNRAAEERSHESDSLVVRESSSGEVTIYDVDRHAFMDSVQNTRNWLQANLPWQYPQPMEVIGEVTEEMILAVSYQWSHESASLSNVVAEPSAASEPSQQVQPNAENASENVDDTEKDRRSTSSPMTPPVVLDNTLTQEQAAMAPFSRSLESVQSVNSDRIYVCYPRSFFIELPDSDESMDEDDTTATKRNDGGSKDVSATLNETEKTLSSAVIEEKMDIDECVSNKDDGDDVPAASRDASVLEQSLDATQESEQQKDESIENDDDVPMEIESVFLDDGLEGLDDTRMSKSPVADEEVMEIDENVLRKDDEDDVPAASRDVSVLDESFDETHEIEHQKDESIENDDGMPMEMDVVILNDVSDELDDSQSPLADEKQMEESPGSKEDNHERHQSIVTRASSDGSDALKMIQESYGSSDEDEELNAGLKLPQAIVTDVVWNKPGYVMEAGPNHVPEVPVVDHRDDDLDMGDSEDEGNSSDSHDMESEPDIPTNGYQDQSMRHCPTCRCDMNENMSIDQVELAYREWEEAGSGSIRGDVSDEEDDHDLPIQEDGRDVEDDQMPQADPKIARLVDHLDGLVQQCKRLMSALEEARSGNLESLEAVQSDEARRLAEIEAVINAELTDRAVPLLGDVELPQRLITSLDNLSDTSSVAHEDLIDQGMDEIADVAPPQPALVDYESDSHFDDSPASPMPSQPINEAENEVNQPDFSIDQMPEFDFVPLEDDESVFNVSEYSFTASPQNQELGSDASSIVNPADLESSDEDMDVDDDDQPRRRPRNHGGLESSDDEAGFSNIANIADLVSSDEERHDEAMEVDSSDSSDDDDQPRRNRRAPVRPGPNRRQRRAAPYIVPQPRRRARRSRPINLEFGNLRHITDIDGINLPDAPPTVNMEHLFVVDNTRLSADQQIAVVSGDRFQAALYRSGHVVLLGPFGNAPMGSALLRQAVEQPVVVWSNLADPIISIAAGPDHLIMLSDAGRIFTIGQAEHGQLGVPNPAGYRQSDLRPDMLLRQVFEGFQEVRFASIRAEGNNSVAITKDGKEYSCGEDYGDLFHRTL